MLLVSPGRAGVCRGDLIAAVALLLVSGGVAAPAIYQAGAKQDRDAAVNQLKWHSLACLSAQDVHRRLPPIAGELSGKQGSLHFHLLPYLEEERTWKAGDLTASIKVMRDPADRSAPAGGIYKRTFGTTSYAGNWLVFKGGPRAPDAAKLTDIVDGVSNTLMFAERYQMCAGTPCAWGYDQFYYPAPMFAYFSQGKFQVHPTQEICNPALPQSIHREGMLCSFCDGSARLAGNDISPLTWALLTCPNDGQVIPELTGMPGW
jgi:hypothetical protein